jgi:hypothetical protein
VPYTPAVKITKLGSVPASRASVLAPFSRTADGIRHLHRIGACAFLAYADEIRHAPSPP